MSRLSSRLRACSSSLRVVSSSFADCSSSFAASCSSLRLWSSSFAETSSSLLEVSSSRARPCSSIAACSEALAAASSSATSRARSRSSARAGRAALDAGTLPPAGTNGSNSTRKSCCFESGCSASGDDDHAARAHRAVVVEPQPFLADGGRALLRGGERRAERGDEAHARHLEQVVLRLPRRRLEVRAGPPPELEDVHPVVDDDAGRPVAGEEHAVGVRREVSRRAAGARSGPRRWATGAAAGSRPCAAGSAPPCARTTLFARSTGEKRRANPVMFSLRPEQEEAGLVQRVVERRDAPSSAARRRSR